MRLQTLPVYDTTSSCDAIHTGLASLCNELNFLCAGVNVSKIKDRILIVEVKYKQTIVLCQFYNGATYNSVLGL